MHPNQSCKTVSAGTSFTAAGTAVSATIDTQGYDSASISVWSSITNTWSTLAIQHADTNAATSFSTISGPLSGPEYTAPVWTTASGTTAATGALFNISTKAKKRYLRVLCGGATAATATISCSLGQAASVPFDATSYGAVTLVTA